MSRHPLLALLLILAADVAHSDDVIATMDQLKFNLPKAGGTAEVVPGHEGQAVQFKFDKDAKGTFFTSNIRGTPDWDQAAGFSFWVRGDGSDSFGGLQLIWNDNFALRYDLMFPIKSQEWTKVTVAWRDLIPTLPAPSAKPIDPASENKPSKFSALWFGKWWYWSAYPAHSYAIDDIRLEREIPLSPTPTVSAGQELAHTAKKLKAGEPITIVTMGDSLTDYRHWANRMVAWPKLLKERIEAKYKSRVTIINPAIGGTQLRQNLVLMPRWLAQTPQPDLVTVCFGGNDWQAGMRGEMFTAATADAVERIRRATDGKSDVLLLTTVPGAERWETYAELSEAARKSAADRHAGLADVEKLFHERGRDDHFKLFAWDKVHLSPAGHEAMVESVLGTIEAAE